MGATGAGKSTLARCLTRLVPCFLPADLRGEIRLLGQPIDGARVGALAGTIGMVFQDFEAQLFSTDVTQEIVFGLQHTGVAPVSIAASGPPPKLLADVDACLAAGVRPPDICRVFAALGLTEPPLEVASAAGRLRARGLVPAPVEPAPAPAAGPAIIEIRGLGHRYP